MADERDEQAFLVGEMAVDRELGNTGRSRDAVDRSSFETEFEKQLRGSVKDGRTLLHVLRASEQAGRRSMHGR